MPSLLPLTDRVVCILALRASGKIEIERERTVQGHSGRHGERKTRESVKIPPRTGLPRFQTEKSDDVAERTILDLISAVFPPSTLLSLPPCFRTLRSLFRTSPAPVIAGFTIRFGRRQLARESPRQAACCASTRVDPPRLSEGIGGMISELSFPVFREGGRAEVGR